MRGCGGAAQRDRAKTRSLRSRRSGVGITIDAVGKSRPESSAALGRVIAYHLVLTCYGFWLPNDPRGSGSKTVRAKHLREFGPATYVDAKRSVARRPHDWRLRLLAKSKLMRPAVRLNGVQARAVARGFAKCLALADVACFACAVLPEHAHLIVARGERPAEALMIDLKAAAVHELLVDGLHPFQATRNDPSGVAKMWGRSGRKVYLSDDESIRRSITYVEMNPTFDGLPKQHWSWVRTYDGLG